MKAISRLAAGRNAFVVALRGELDDHVISAGGVIEYDQQLARSCTIEKLEILIKKNRTKCHEGLLILRDDLSMFLRCAQDGWVVIHGIFIRDELPFLAFLFVNARPGLRR